MKNQTRSLLGLVALAMLACHQLANLEEKRFEPLCHLDQPEARLGKCLLGR